MRVLDLVKQAKKNTVVNMAVPASHGLRWTYLADELAVVLRVQLLYECLREMAGCRRA